MAAEQDSEKKGIQNFTFNVSTMGDNALVAAVAGQRVYILGFLVSAAGGSNLVSLQDTGGAVLRSPIWDLHASGMGIEEIEVPIAPPGRFWEKTEVGAGLDINLSDATSVTGTLVFQQF